MTKDSEPNGSKHSLNLVWNLHNCIQYSSHFRINTSIATSFQDIIMLFQSMGVRLWLWTAATDGPVVHPPPDDICVRSLCGIILTREIRRYRRKTCPNAIFFTTNVTWTDPGTNPAFRGERSATNSVNHGTARIKINCFVVYLFIFTLFNDAFSVVSAIGM
jgi:hypothetical protein